VAFERQNQIMVVDLEELVRLRLESLNKIKTQIRVREEMKFQSSVLSDDIDLESQLAYREDLIKKEQKKNVPDNDYITSLKADRSLLHKQIRTFNYREAYQASFNEYKAKRTSADSHLTFLQDNLSTTNDITLRQEILSNIGTMESEIVTKHENAVMLQITNALEDMTFSVLQEAIDLATTERNKSRMIADVDTAAMYDVRLTVLKKSYRSARIQNDLNKVDLAVRGGKGIDHKLDWMIKQKDKPSTGDAADSFSFDGIQYANEADFWGQHFTTFVAGEYFTTKETELKNKATSLYNQFGDISNENMAWIKEQTNAVFDNPALAPWKDTLGKTFQQSVLMGALDYKMTNLQQELAMQNTPEGIKSINQKVMDLQASVPEISQHASFAALSQAYATKQQTMLQTRLQTFVDSKTKELNLLVDALGNRADISEEDRNKAKNSIAGMQAQLGMMTTNVNFMDIPLEQFTFGQDPNKIYNALIQPYAGLSGATQLEGINFDEWIDTAIGGFAEQRGVEIPGSKPAPAAGTTAPSTPNVAGSANFEKELYLQGDEGKQETMAGWGYKWDYSDQANQIGGWTPISTEAKNKFKQTYGHDWTGKKATLQKGDMKVISFAEGDYSKGLFDQGYKKI